MEEIKSVCINKKQLISIIVPIYNVERKLPLCINSILAQTYTQFELLLINDGSTDRSGKICDKYSAKDMRCKVIHQNNQGVSEARNVGLKTARGTYIAFIDSDDWVHPKYLEYLHRAVNEGDYSLSMVLGVLSHIKDIQNVSVEIPYSTKMLSGDMLMAGLFCKTISRRLGSEIPYGVVWGRLYRKDLLDGLFFKDTMHEDTEYSNRVFNRIEQAVVVNERMYYWIQYPDSLHHSIPPRKEQMKIDCFLLSLNEIPKVKHKIRGYCLDRLFKAIVYCKYVYEEYNAYRPFRDEAFYKAKVAFKSYKSEFIRNKYIPITNKVGLLICYYIPPVYSLIMWFFEVKMKVISALQS